MLYVVTVKDANSVLQEFKASEFDLPLMVQLICESESQTLVSVRFDE